MPSDRFSPKTSLKGISWFGIRKSLVAAACLLLVLLVFGMVRIPEPFLAIALSTSLVLVFPGYLLSDLVFRQHCPWPKRGALAFALSVGLWLILAASALWLHGNLKVVIGAMLGVTLLLASITLLRPPTNQSTQTRPSSTDGVTTDSNRTGAKREWSRLVYWVILVACSALILVIFANASAPVIGDRVGDQAFLRHFLDSDRFLAEGFRLSASHTIVTARDFTQGWVVLLAMIIRLAQVDMLDAYVYYLPPLMIFISFLAFYALATELLRNQIAALSACLVQILYYLSDVAVHEGIGYSLLLRITQDKFAMRFTLLPIAYWLTLRTIKRRERSSLISLLIVMIALALVHPIGMAMYSISFGLFLLMMLLFGSWSERRKKLVQVLPILFAILLMLLIPLVERQQMAYYSTANRFLGEVEENMDPLRATRLLMLGGEMGLYIASPQLVNHPLVILAILLTALLIPYLRTRLSAQFLFANMVGVLLLCYTPFLAPILGILVTPWLIWRVLWLLPVSLVIGFFLGETEQFSRNRLKQMSPQGLRLIPMAIILSGALLLRGKIDDGLEYLARVKGTRVLTAEQREVLVYLRENGTPGSIIMTPDTRLSNEIPGLVGHSYGITFRNISPLAESAQEDRERFYSVSLLTNEHIDTLQEYDLNYIILETGTELAGQFKGMPGMFSLLYANETLELYGVSPDVGPNPTITGNTHLVRGEWDQAIASFSEALRLKPANALAHLGLAKAYQAQGYANRALSEYRRAIVANPEVFVPETVDSLSQNLDIDPVYLLPFLAHGEYYRTRPDADLVNSNWAIFSFLERLDSAHVPSGSRDFVRRAAFVIEGQPKGVLFQHPTSQVTFQVNILPAARLRFSPAISPEVWQLGRGDGVQFDIYLDNGEAEWLLYSEYLDPKNVSSHRQWLDREVDLSHWAGEIVTITFATGSGPNGDERYDWAGWGEPRIVRPIAFNFLAELPNADRGGAGQEQVRQDTITIDYQPRPVLFQHPSSQVTYRVEIPREAGLYFGLGLDPVVWSPDHGDGVEYNVYVSELDNPALLHRVFHRYVDPKSNPEDRQWLDQVVDMSLYDGQTVDLVFETLPGSAGDASFDWSCWSAPVLVGMAQRP